MDEEAIKKLVKDTITSQLVAQMDSLLKPVTDQLQKDVQTFITETTTDLEDRINAKTFNGGKSKGKEESTVETSRIAKLEADLKEEKELRVKQEAAAKELRFTKDLSTALDSQPNLLSKNTVKEIIANRFMRGGVEEKDGKWLNASGNELTEVVNQFINSDEGKLFTSATHKDGTGVKETSGRSGGGTQSVSLSEMLEDF